MTDNNDFDSLLSQLQQLKNSEDYLSISNTLDHRFHSTINDIIKKWIKKNILSNEEKEFFDLYSNLQLSFVKYCFFNSDTTATIQTMISDLRVNLFKKTQTEVLADAVAFIREDYFNNSNDPTKEDLILVYIMQMLDARSLAYRLCFEDLKPPPTELNDALKDCLTHRQAKNYLYDVKSMDKTNTNMFIDSRHKFFIGCCTYAVALFDGNKGFLKEKNQNKYIFLLAKYVRIMLNQTNFEQDESILYCLRGVLALLNNCVPTDNWLPIINKALANKDDDNAQQANPFNINLFSLIINQLLGSNILRDEAMQLNSYYATSLADVALIFLNKWFDTSSDLNDDDDDDNDKNNNKSVSTHEPNQVLRLLRSNIKIDENVSTSQIIIPYFEAKYDRLRLMAISTLSVIMSYKDFKDLEKEKVNMAKDIVKLIFRFIGQAVAQKTRQYKGISLERLLCYLLRFLVQDAVKVETVPYVSQIIDYAKRRHIDIDAFKILRKLSTSPDIHKVLLENADLKQFLETDAETIYGINEKMYKYIKDIRQNLALQEQKVPLTPNNAAVRQAFISYSHRDTDRCNSFVEALRQANVFDKVWIDRENVKDNVVDAITSAIRQSEVVFVLLSDGYSTSDMCRGEWEFALHIKKKIYVTIVQEDFDRDKVYRKDALESLIDILRTNRHEQPQAIKKTMNDSNESHAVLLSITENNQLEDAENTKNQSIAGWTSEDVQTWCRENKLKQWCEPLVNYHGRALLELNRLLKTDVYLQHIATNHGISILDVILFKSELDKLVSETAVTPKLSMKKHVTKRRASKSSTK